MSERTPPIGEPARHDSAHLHVSGRAQYADDIPLPANALHAAFGLSRIAHGRIGALDASAALALPGVVAVGTAADVPGENNYGSVLHDDPIFADAIVQYAGQPVFAAVADCYRTARRAAALVQVEYAPLPAILDVRAALAAQSYVLPTECVQRGRPLEMLSQAPHRLRGSVEIGGQDHFYLEGQIAIAMPQEDGGMLVHSSTQHPSEVQQIVAHALGRRAHAVTVQCRRMGGGFGGKETQPALIAAAAAVLAHKTARPVKLRLDRDVDMLATGKRHDFVADYEVGFERDGRIVALDVMLASRCGYSADLSGPVNDRAVMHLDNAYYLEHVRIVSHRCKTHTVSNTAFRGFGGPQGMLVIEQILADIARTLQLDPLAVRRANFYGAAPRDVTPYGQTVEDNILEQLVGQLADSSRYAARRAEIAAWNASDPVIRRGLALTPVKFGISFTSTMFNQAGALVHVYNDGTVLLNHGGTEMGQGLFTKVAQVVAAELGVPLSLIRVSATDTAKVPNTSASAASASSDLNGKAAQAAARAIRQRLEDWLCESYGVAASQVHFGNGRVTVGSQRVQLCRRGTARLPRAHLAVLHRLLPHAEDRVGQGAHARPAILLFCLWRRCQRSGRGYAQRRDAAAARRHPARRGRLAESGHRSGPDRGRLSPGRWLADLRAALVERPRRAANACALDLQDTHRTRLACPGHDPHARACPESRGHDLPFEGRRRAAAHARHLDAARDPRCRGGRRCARRPADAAVPGNTGGRVARAQHQPPRQLRRMSTADRVPWLATLRDWPGAVLKQLEHQPCGRARTRGPPARLGAARGRCQHAGRRH